MNGSLDTDAAAKALMQYLNTPLQNSNASPAQLLTGRQLRDAIPVDSANYRVSEQWSRLLRSRERALQQLGKNASLRHNVSAHVTSRPLNQENAPVSRTPAAGVGDRLGTIIELTAPQQYLVRLDGSGRATIRNRRHLRPLISETQAQSQDGGSSNPAPPSTAARPRRVRRAPQHFNDYIVYNVTELGTSQESISFFCMCKTWIFCSILYCLCLLSPPYMFITQA